MEFIDFTDVKIEKFKHTFINKEKERILFSIEELEIKMAVIDMQTMRYINLLEMASHVKTHTCFVYNNTIMFAVPRAMVSKALGPDAINIRRIQEELGKRVRILPAPESKNDLNEFISKLIAPVGFKSIEVKEGECIINAGSQHKASLIGRNRRRFEELQIVIKDLFSLELKII